MSIMGNMVGSYSQIGKTFIIEDENGNELTGVATSNEVILTATDSDVRDGSIYAGDHGISVGKTHIPLYNYAIIDASGLCNDVCGTHLNHDGDNGYVVIPEYNPSYIGNYYNVADGKWYADADFEAEANN